MGQGRELDGSIREVGLVALIRDENGNVRFDDPNNVPPAILNALTPKDIEYLETLRNQ